VVVFQFTIVIRLVRFNTIGSTEVCMLLLIMHCNRWDDNYCSNILFTST